MVSGIGCTGRMAGYIKIDSFHTTHGRALPSPRV
jgi:2-oxoglutarate ferredoxin oxidoreductase subunit beta